MMNVDAKLASYRAPDGSKIHGTYFGKPKELDAFGFKWDGEWEVTFVTFRDMGLAFGAALVLIYMLVVAEFRNFTLPMVVMAPIPLTLIGIIPGHWMLGADFTATSMIGFIALAGIIVRNSILLVDFAKSRVEEGMSVRDAVVMAAEVRLRPIVITALALVIGSTVLLTDPIFQGMAVSLLFGSIVATFLTLVVIPLGCFSAQKAFQCKDGGICSERTAVPPTGSASSAPSGAPPSGDAIPSGRPVRLEKRTEPPASEPTATAAEAPQSSGRPPRLAKKTEAESAAVAASEAAPAAVSGRPPRLTKKTDAESSGPAVEAVATPTAASGRPARLQKREEAAAPVVAAPAAPPSGGRPPRLSKQTASQAEVVKPVDIPAPEVAPVAPEPVLAAPVAPKPAMESDKEPVSSRKRKLRGIRIKNMNEESEK
jgi:hypothetical protein